MGVEKIIDRINADVNSEIHQIKTKTGEEVLAIASRAEKDADDEYNRILSDGRREIRASVRKILAQASLDARQIIREEREKGISLCFFEAEKSLNYLTGASEYRTILKNLILSGIKELGIDEIVLVSTERDRSLIAPIITDIQDNSLSITLQPECAITMGGVILKSKSGKITLNNTFEARMERLRNDLVFGIARLLHGGE